MEDDPIASWTGSTPLNGGIGVQKALAAGQECVSQLVDEGIIIDALGISSVEAANERLRHTRRPLGKNLVMVHKRTCLRA
jgi:hypothetical protein